MKKLSIKLKLTLWFMLFMTLLAAILISFIFFFSRSQSRRNTENALIARVSENALAIGYDHDELIIDEDFLSYRGGIYCLILNEDGQVRGGQTPEEALENEKLRDGLLREISLNGEDYLTYDLRISEKRREIWIRGIVSESGAQLESASLYSAVFISIPLLILLAAAGGYLLAGRTLMPIRVISAAAEEIGASGDLSRRIDMDENGDELHRLAGSFNRMFERLEKNFEAEKQFTSDASHELRNPIATILAQCEYAFENASGEDELYEVIGDIEKQGRRMSRLVESLLSFTRLEQQTERADFEDTDLSALFSGVLDEQKALPEKNITLTDDIEPGIRMQADASLMTRLLVNLVRNAYRYGKENGHIHVKLSENENRIILSVSDDGIGIAPEELPKIWNRFYRADKSRTAGKGAGLGLGLSMVKQIVSLHKGEIRVASAPGEGSVFSAEFPAAPLASVKPL
ncbi:MAG: HAMP domain-containing histidine kinase [Lachnospiraceae bacterium]|nr:HAMP domain-containing histidine kinase [Lachnospiraceae bacterium]